MRRALLQRAFSLCKPNNVPPLPLPPRHSTSKLNPNALRSPAFTFRFRPFSSDIDSSSDPKPESSSDPNPESSSDPKPETSLSAPTESSLAEAQLKEFGFDVEDVSNKDLKVMIEKYFKGDEEVLPDILEAIVKRKMTKQHEETDDELLDELAMQPLNDVKDNDFESDFEELHNTDDEIDDLYNARDVVMSRMKDEYFNMDDKKWDAIIKEGTEHGWLKDTRECEAILEDMLSWDKLLPDDMKKLVEAKFNELGDMAERGEIAMEEAYERFKEFEDTISMEYVQKMEEEGPPQFDDTPGPDKDSDDPPGEGLILTWKSRIVFGPGPDAWHPKNRKVKMGVTVKEIGMSKYQFRRLRELVGKRYHPGKDELMITSERHEHREENRKDCLRTFLKLIEEAGKANKIVDDARTSYVKERLRANPAFMERLRAKKAMRLHLANPVPA